MITFIDHKIYDYSHVISSIDCKSLSREPFGVRKIYQNLQNGEYNYYNY